MYIYENHLGGFYSSYYELEYEDTYCGTCNDSDHLIGVIDSAEDLIKRLADEISYPADRGGYDLVYILNFVNETFDNAPTTKEKLIEIIVKARKINEQTKED